MSPAASATAASRTIALRRYRPTQPPASAVPLTAVGIATWACGLTANRSRTYVPSHSDPGPPEIPTRTRDRGGVTSLQGPTPGHVLSTACTTLAGRPFKYTKTGKLWNNIGGTKKLWTRAVLGIASNLVFG